MSQGNVVDLSVQFAMSKPAAALLKRAATIGAVADELTAILCTLNHTEQRFLAAMIAWRIEGGQALPASDLLTKLPSLHGLEFGSICATAEGLAEAEVIRVVPVGKDEKGKANAMGFVWPALERLMELGDQRATGPKLTDLQGNPLR